MFSLIAPIFNQAVNLPWAFNQPRRTCEFNTRRLIHHAKREEKKKKLLHPRRARSARWHFTPPNLVSSLQAVNRKTYLIPDRNKQTAHDAGKEAFGSRNKSCLSHRLHRRSSTSRCAGRGSSLEEGEEEEGEVKHITWPAPTPHALSWLYVVCGQISAKYLNLNAAVFS